MGVGMIFNYFLKERVLKVLIFLEASFISFAPCGFIFALTKPNNIQKKTTFCHAVLHNLKSMTSEFNLQRVFFIINILDDKQFIQTRIISKKIS